MHSALHAWMRVAMSLYFQVIVGLSLGLVMRSQRFEDIDFEVYAASPSTEKNHVIRTAKALGRASLPSDIVCDGRLLGAQSDRLPAKWRCGSASASAFGLLALITLWYRCTHARDGILGRALRQAHPPHPD